MTQALSVATVNNRDDRANAALGSFWLAWIAIALIVGFATHSAVIGAAAGLALAIVVARVVFTR